MSTASPVSSSNVFLSKSGQTFPCAEMGFLPTAALQDAFTTRFVLIRKKESFESVGQFSESSENLRLTTVGIALCFSKLQTQYIVFYAILHRIN